MAKNSVPLELSSDDARTWWLALMENVASLVRDSSLLADNGSPGRARSLLVLAAEELGKARWIYEAAEESWTAGGGLVELPADFEYRARTHPEKLAAAADYGDGNNGFWGDWFQYESGRRLVPDQQMENANQFNLHKQAGFYVDRRNGIVTSPADINADGVNEFLDRLAKAASMLFVEDHVRMQLQGHVRNDARQAHTMLLKCSQHRGFREPANLLRPSAEKRLPAT